MSDNDSRGTGALEKSSPTVFLVAGGLFLLFAGYWGAFAVTAMDSEAVQNVVGPAGWTVSFIGLLGLLPKLAAENRRLSLAAAALTVLGLAGALITTIGNSALLLEAVDELPGWFAALQLLLLVGIVPGYLTSAFATLRSDDLSQRIGLLLLVPAGIFVLNIVRVSTLGSTTPVWAPAVLGAGQAFAFLAIGYSLRTERPGPTAAASETVSE